MRSKVSKARRDVAALRQALLLPSPEGIARCLPALIEASQGLNWAESELHKGHAVDADFRADLDALITELHLAAQLIESGAALNHGWANLLGAALAGYTPSGEAAPITAPGAISVRG